MAVARLNGVRLSYRVDGAGEADGGLVVLVTGTGAAGSVWRLHQVPALVAAGYRVATMDNRGIPPSDECADGMTIEDLVGDTAALIEHLGGGPVRLAGTSMGSRVVQELALARPELVSHAVMMAAHGRPDPLQTALSLGDRALHDAGIVLPAKYHAAVTAIRNLSPRTLQDPVAARDWLDLFECVGSATGPGVRAQLTLEDFPDRLAAYAAIRVPSLVIGFADDQVIPAYLGREVARAIPGARYAEVADCGHFGYLERPAEINRLVLDFFAAPPGPPSA